MIASAAGVAPPVAGAGRKRELRDHRIVAGRQGGRGRCRKSIVSYVVVCRRISIAREMVGALFLP
jgi:hypothetical protein